MRRGARRRRPDVTLFMCSPFRSGIMPGWPCQGLLRRHLRNGFLFPDFSLGLPDSDLFVCLETQSPPWMLHAILDGSPGVLVHDGTIHRLQEEMVEGEPCE